MASEGGFWSRVSGEVKQATERTRREARRAVRMGVLRVDLVSLRRDRTRAHANLGERVLQLWTGDALGTIETDPEALRLRALVQEIETAIRAKRDELERLRHDGNEQQAGSNGG